jgi:hypothetical protein
MEQQLYAVKMDKVLVMVKGYVNAEGKLVRDYGKTTVTIASPQYFCRWHERRKRFPDCQDEE